MGMGFEDDLDIAPQTVVPGVDSRERPSLEEIVARLTPEQREEVRDFAEFLLVRSAARPSSAGTSLADLFARRGVPPAE
jgi:hypothetical protein